MGGKAALLLVLGFSTIMLVVGLNMNNISTNAVDNSTNHFESEAAKEVARSGMNLATTSLSRNQSWTPNDTYYSYMGTNNLKISMKDSANMKIITSVGRYEDKSKMIEVKINLSSFSEYAYFSNEEGNIWWTGNDSVWGPFHTNDDLQTESRPYFAGPRTSHGGELVFYKNHGLDKPTIIGTYTPGITIDIPTDGISKMSDAASAGGYVFDDDDEDDVYIMFDGDSIKYKYDDDDDYTTVLGTDLAPNGVIYVDDADLHIQGIVKNRWSIGSNKNVYLDNDIVYSDVPDPKDPNDPSNDLLGILAKKNVIITNNTANQSDINIHAAIYCEEGGFTAENYKNRPVSGDIKLLGGITQEKRGAVGTFKATKGSSKSTIVSGFNKEYKYDSRLLSKVPPYFPSTQTFKVVSWLE